MTQSKARNASLDDRIAAEVARQIAPLRAILERLEAEAGGRAGAAPHGQAPSDTLLKPWPPASAAAPDGAQPLAAQEALQRKEAAVRARIADIERHIAARVARPGPKPKGDSHV